VRRSRIVLSVAVAVTLLAAGPATSAAAAVAAPSEASQVVSLAVVPRSAAGGESYMAGDGGIEFGPYLEGTDTPNNRCHRSNTSPVQLLHRAQLINLVANTACSGATIDMFMSGMYNEPSQISQIPPNLDAYFLSLGGNDAWFGAVSRCIVQTDCTKTSVPAGAFEQVSQLGPRLDTVYRALKAAVPRGKVIVQLYPLILPLPGTKPGPLCPYLNPGEAEIGYNLTTRLNAVIVERARVNGLYTADPQSLFNGRDVCRHILASSFYAFGVGGIGSAFHPNLVGRLTLAWTHYSVYMNN
jgi:hypothetical protein